MHWPFEPRHRKVRSAALTDIGRRHKTNEDAVEVIVPPDGQQWGFDIMAIICDGVSGQPRGDMASKLAIDAFRADFTHPDERPIAERLEAASAAASASIIEYARREMEGVPVATTVVALVVTGQTATIGHVGNSRVYLLRSGDLEVLTADHSFVADQVRQGLLTAADARQHPMRSRISRALGIPDADAMDVNECAVKRGDTFLLSSDGLHDLVAESVIKREIGGDLQQAARRLIELANAAGGPDNITVALVGIN